MHTSDRLQASSRHDGSPLASIWLVPLVASLLATAILAWVSHDEYHETLDQEYRFLDGHARIAETQLAGLLHNARQLLTRVAEEWPRLTPEQKAAYATTLAARNREVPEIRTLAIMDATGRVEMAANPALKGFDASQRMYFTAHRDGATTADFLISPPFKSSFGDYSIAFSVAMRDARGRFLGVAAAGVNYKYFESAMKEIQPEQPGSVVGIINTDGDVAFRLPDPERYVGRNVAAGSAFQTFMRAGRRPTHDIGVSQIDGISRIYAYRAIGDTPLSVLVASPYHHALAGWRHRLMVRIALLACAAALILHLAGIARRRQQEMLAGKEFSERLIETANAMVVGVDADSRVVTVNDATERITGYRRDELVGRSFLDTAMPRDRFPRVWQAFMHCRETGELPRAFEAPLLTRSGEIRIIAWHNDGRFRRNGALAILAFGVDVTERTQLRRLRDREEISRRLVGFQEEERRRLAIELHDRTSPNLTILDIKMRLLARSLPANAPPELVHLTEDMSATLADTIASIRSASVDFRPPLLDYAGLWPALSAYARQFQQRTGIAVRIDGQKGLRLAPDVETNLFHLAQEALANCAKHSSAREIVIRETSQGDEVILTIADDGVGFDPAACAATQGLAMMRQRAEFIGAKFYVGAHPGKGACVAVRLRPCRQRRATTRYAPQSHAAEPVQQAAARDAAARETAGQ